jgi:predicted chitinase
LQSGFAVLNDAVARFEINTAARLAAFLAQTAHESGELNRLMET